MDALKQSTNLDPSPVSSGQEPVSGEQGKGTVSEPFDQGNAEGKEGASAAGAGGKEGMAGALEDTKGKAEELIGKGT